MLGIKALLIKNRLHCIDITADHCNYMLSLSRFTIEREVNEQAKAGSNTSKSQIKIESHSLRSLSQLAGIRTEYEINVKPANKK